VVVRFAASQLEMRRVVRHICIVTGCAIHKGSVRVVGGNLGFVAESFVAAEYVHRIPRRRITLAGNGCG